MVDVFIKGKFYIIQIDGDEIGLSLDNENRVLFDIIPDKSFKDPGAFHEDFEKIFD